MNFQEILRARRPSLRWPSCARWSAEDRGSQGVWVRADLPGEVLNENLQTRGPSSFLYLLLSAWWLERELGRPVYARLCLTGAIPESPHAWRARLVISELSAALGGRFVVEPPPSCRWPADPVVNAPRQPRSALHARAPLSEHALEVQLTTSPGLLADFQARVAPITSFQRQLPVGLFDGRVKRATQVTPGGASQVDLWAPSPDGRVVHLFELKTRGNAEVGMVAEALYYGLLLREVQRGRVGGGGPGMDAIRRAERLIFWLIAPEYHPLVYDEGVTPLSWLHEGLDGLELRLLPFALSESGSISWLPDVSRGTWGSAPR